jgi:hypothetical protein
MQNLKEESQVRVHFSARLTRYLNEVREMRVRPSEYFISEITEGISVKFWGLRGERIYTKIR